MQQPPETTRAHEKATGSGNQESQLGNCFAISHEAKTTVDGPKNKKKYRSKYLKLSLLLLEDQLCRAERGKLPDCRRAAASQIPWRQQ